jgi:hypothetical protein
MRPSPRKRPAFVTALVLLGLAGIVSAADALERPSVPAQCVWENVERVVAVGDLHGDQEAFLAILQNKGLIDGDGKWIGGKAHLVQLGDAMDRGDFARGILRDIRRLEKEAAADGGMVHFLPGNHEEMNLAGVSLDYLGYVSPQQFVDFLPDAYARQQERWTRGMNHKDKMDFWQKLMKDPGARAMYYRGFRGEFGEWIGTRNVIVKIDGVVFVHGGIRSEDSRRSLESINVLYRREFALAGRGRLESPEFLFQPFSPLWNRDLGDPGTSLTKADVEQILSNLKARAIVIGHTPGDGAIRFDGLVWAIDTDISGIYEDSWLSALEVQGGKIWLWRERHVPKSRDGDLDVLVRLVGDLGLRLIFAGAAGHF